MPKRCPKGGDPQAEYFMQRNNQKKRYLFPDELNERSPPVIYSPTPYLFFIPLFFLADLRRKRRRTNSALYPPSPPAILAR